MMHVVYPKTMDWRFSPALPDQVDPDFVMNVTWDQHRLDFTYRTALAVLIQPPWIATQADLESFAGCRKVRTRLESAFWALMNNQVPKSRT